MNAEPKPFDLEREKSIEEIILQTESFRDQADMVPELARESDGRAFVRIGLNAEPNEGDLWYHTKLLLVEGPYGNSWTKTRTYIKFSPHSRSRIQEVDRIVDSEDTSQARLSFIVNHDISEVLGMPGLYKQN